MFGLLLGRESLYDWDEAWYGQVAKELLRGGDWLTLHWRGIPFFDKPPLGIWAIALSFRTFGQNEWAARLPSALCSVLTVLVLFRIGKRIFGKERPALFSALVLLTTLPFVKAGRMAMLDGPLAFAFTLGIWTFLEAREKENSPWGLGLGLSFALVWMIKGPVAILLALTLLAFSLWERNGKALKSPWILPGLLLVLPWYLAEWSRHGQAFLQSHFGIHMLGRAATVLDAHQGPPWYYLGHIALAGPWFVLFLCALPFLWKKRKETWVRLGVCWAGVVVLAFSLAATKLPWYVVPAYPGLALLLGGFLDSFGKKRPYFALTASYLLLLGLIGHSLHWEARYAPDLRPFSKVQLKQSTGILSLSKTIRPAFIYYLDRPELLTTPEELPEQWQKKSAALLSDVEKKTIFLKGAKELKAANGLVLLEKQNP